MMESKRMQVSMVGLHHLRLCNSLSTLFPVLASFFSLELLLYAGVGM